MLKCSVGSPQQGLTEHFHIYNLKSSNGRCFVQLNIEGHGVFEGRAVTGLATPAAAAVSVGCACSQSDDWQQAQPGFRAAVRGVAALSGGSSTRASQQQQPRGRRPPASLNTPHCTAHWCRQQLLETLTRKLVAVPRPCTSLRVRVLEAVGDISAGIVWSQAAARAHVPDKAAALRPGPLAKEGPVLNACRAQQQQQADGAAPDFRLRVHALKKGGLRRKKGGSAA